MATPKFNNQNKSNKSNKIKLPAVTETNWIEENNLIIPRYSFPILDAIKEDRFYWDEENRKYIIVSKDIAELIKPDSKKPVFWDGKQNIEYDKITEGVVENIKKQYDAVKEKIIDELTEKKIIENGQVEEVEEKLQKAIKTKTDLTGYDKTIYDIYLKYETELPKFDKKIGFDAVAAFEELLTVKGKKLDIIKEIPADLHARVLNSLSDYTLIENLKDILETVKIQKKPGFAIPQIKTICDHLESRELLTTEDKFYDLSGEEVKKIKQEDIVTKTQALNDKIIAIKADNIKTDNIKTNFFNIILPYVGASRPAIVLQKSKENDPYFSMIGVSTKNQQTEETGLEGNGLFYNGSTKAVDCLLVIKRKDGSLFTIVGKRQNAEDWALYGGIQSALKDDKDTAFDTMVKELLEETGNHQSQVKKENGATDEDCKARKDRQIKLEAGVKSLFKKLATLDGAGQNADPRKTDTASMSTTMFSVFIDIDKIEEMKKLYELTDGEISALNWISKDLAKGITKANNEMTSTKNIEIVDKDGQPTKIEKLFAGHSLQIKETMPIILYKSMLLEAKINNMKIAKINSMKVDRFNNTPLDSGLNNVKFGKPLDIKTLYEKTLKEFNKKYDIDTNQLSGLKNFIETEIKKEFESLSQKNNNTTMNVFERLSRKKQFVGGGRF